LHEQLGQVVVLSPEHKVKAASLILEQACNVFLATVEESLGTKIGFTSRKAEVKF